MSVALREDPASIFAMIDCSNLEASRTPGLMSMGSCESLINSTLCDIESGLNFVGSTFISELIKLFVTMIPSCSDSSSSVGIKDIAMMLSAGMIVCSSIV